MITERKVLVFFGLFLVLWVEDHYAGVVKAMRDKDFQKLDKVWYDSFQRGEEGIVIRTLLEKGSFLSIRR